MCLSLSATDVEGDAGGRVVGSTQSGFRFAGRANMQISGQR